MTLLIVDDSPIVVNKLQEMLRTVDKIKEIHTANSYNESLEKLQQIVPDVAILDIQLPDKNGIELLKYLKQTYPAIIIIMFTNQTHEQYRIHCEEIGAEFFIDKSNEFDKIAPLISSLIP